MMSLQQSHPRAVTDTENTALGVTSRYLMRMRKSTGLIDSMDTLSGTDIQTDMAVVHCTR